MPESIQPDLFGDYDHAQEEARWRQPATCPACAPRNEAATCCARTTGAEPGQPGICGFQPGERPSYAAMCTAQYLVTNHIAYATRKDNTEQLARDKARGRELGLDVDAIEAAARAKTLTY